MQTRKNVSRQLWLENNQIASHVTAKFKEGWSPEQIASRIGIYYFSLSIRHEAIYQYIYHPETENRQNLIRGLRRVHRKRKAKYIGRKERKTKIPNRIPIDLRPPLVERSLRYGHWEVDSLVSRKSLLYLTPWWCEKVGSLCLRS